MSAQQASAALHISADTAQNSLQEIERYQDSTPSDDSHHNEEEHPNLTKFPRSGGTDSILPTTNFTYRELLRIYDRLADFIARFCKVWGGSRSQYLAKDMLFIKLAVLKHGSNWDWLANIFNAWKGSALERARLGFINRFSDKCYRIFVHNNAKCAMMSFVHPANRHFWNYPCANYAPDVTFQLAYRPSGHMREGTVYYSRMHKAYDYKVEVNLLPTGLVIGCTLPRVKGRYRHPTP